MKFSGFGYAGSCRHVFLLLPTTKNSLFIMARRLPKMFQSNLKCLAPFYIPIKFLKNCGTLKTRSIAINFCHFFDKDIILKQFTAHGLNLINHMKLHVNRPNTKKARREKRNEQESAEAFQRTKKRKFYFLISMNFAKWLSGMA